MEWLPRRTSLRWRRRTIRLRGGTMTKTRIIAAIGVSCAALFAAGAHAQTMRKNEFYFSTPLLIQPFHFTLKEYRVTQGQPDGGVSDSIDTAKHYASIYVLAGRKK